MAENKDGVIIALLPSAADPVTAASGVQPQAHMTLVFLGLASEIDPTLVHRVRDALIEASLDAPASITATVSERGSLGDSDADVVFADSEELQALRTMLLALEPVQEAFAAAEQHAEWTPHVTLGYDDSPAAGEYEAGEIVFDRLGLWVGENYEEYGLGADDSEEIPGEEIAAALADMEVPRVPFHGVAAPADVLSGDGRMLSPNITNRELPLPFAWQKESQPGHFASWVVGSIEKLWLDEADNLYKYEGFFVDIPEAYEYITLIVEARTRGVSVDIDSAVVELMDGDGNAIDIWAEDFDPDTEIISYMSQGRFCGITGVPIPAFQEAFIDLGTWDEALAADAECEDCDEALVASAQDTSIDLVGDEYCMAGCGDKATMIVEVASNVSACFCAEHGAAAVSGDVLATVPDDAREFLEGFVEGGGPAITAAAFAPGTKDGPGWVTNPQATARIRRYWVRGKGAAKIRWGAPGDFNRCRRQLAKYVQNPEWLAGLCANMHKEALGIWPGQHGPDGAALAASAGPAWTIVTPRAALTAGGYMPSKSWFDNPNFTVKTPVTITEDGRIFGHVASWDQCHIGYEQCVSAPRSNSGYSYFHTGVVDTDEGPVAVGQITMNANHPDLYMSASEAKSHYDNTALAVADVRAGEDNIGIWVAGVLRPGVTDEQRYALKAAGALSGDWRPVGAGFEMVAALAVNTPGFPIPRVAIAASGALVAAAIVRQGPIVTDPVEDAARRAAAYAVEEFEGRRARRERLHALSQRSRTERQGALVASLGTEE